MRPFFSRVCVSRKAGESRRRKGWFFITQQNKVQSGRTTAAASLYQDALQAQQHSQQRLRPKPGLISRCSTVPLSKHTVSESWAETTRGWSWCFLSLLIMEILFGEPQSRCCPFTQDMPYCTCCKCLSPFSFAGLLSDPLLLPDCSFSFSRAVAYANVSCRRLKHKRKLGGVQRQHHHWGRLRFPWPLEVVPSHQPLWQWGPDWPTLIAFLPGK